MNSSLPAVPLNTTTTLPLVPLSGLVLAVVAMYLFFRQSPTERLPPGPPGMPIVGNILEVLPADSWMKFTEYKQKYGDLLLFRGLGNTVLVLNSMKAINDLLDKRSANYSDRPSYTVAGELMNIRKATPFMRYGSEWRAHRKMQHIILSPTASKQYHSVQEDLATFFCQQLLQTPENLSSHARLIAAKTIMSITYGWPVEVKADEYIPRAAKTMSVVEKALLPGSYLADLLPFLKHAPSWVPFKKDGKMGREMFEYLITNPFERVKREMEAGKAAQSLARDLLSSSTGEPELDDRIRWTLGSMYAAGSETTYATVLVFIMAMALHPEKQRLAQDELDRVVGVNRFPSMSDRERLPYVGALVREVMRWYPVVPLSIARETIADDEYNGYLIPKGTLVVPNVWAVALEAGGQYDEHEFVPERFLDAKNPLADPFNYAFGFGKRICPGKHLSENSLFMLMAGVLSVFDISPDPKEPLVPEFIPGLIIHPKPFKCRIVPRSAAHEAIINSGIMHSSS